VKVIDVSYSFVKKIELRNLLKLLSKVRRNAGHSWLIPVILATQEAEMRRMVAQSQTMVNSS
jgi:hypothetical protein